MASVRDPSQWYTFISPPSLPTATTHRNSINTAISTAVIDMPSKGLNDFTQTSWSSPAAMSCRVALHILQVPSLDTVATC